MRPRGWGARQCLVFSVVWALGACATQELTFEHAPLALDPPRVSGTVALEVRDVRYDVTGKGGVAPCHVGTYYSEWGDQGELLLGGERCESLAGVLERDLSAELRQLGFEVGPGGRLQVHVTVHEWEYDGYHSGLLVYDVQVVVTDAAGRERANTHTRHTQMLPDARTRDSRETASKRLPGVYDALVKALLRGNPPVLSALQGR